MPNQVSSPFHCIDFHQPEWVWRVYRLYLLTLPTGEVRRVWARDAVDAYESISYAPIAYTTSNDSL